GFDLGSQNPLDNYTWGINRIYLTGSVAPGSTYTFTQNVTAPTVTGTYNFQWQMLQENVSWFGDLTTNVPVTAAALPDGATFVSQTVPTNMLPGRTYPVTVVMKNTGTNTWSSGGGYTLGSENPRDNFNWGT